MNGEKSSEVERKGNIKIVEERGWRKGVESTKE